MQTSTCRVHKCSSRCTQPKQTSPWPLKPNPAMKRNGNCRGYVEPRCPGSPWQATGSVRGCTDWGRAARIDSRRIKLAKVAHCFLRLLVSCRCCNMWAAKIRYLANRNCACVCFKPSAWLHSNGYQPKGRTILRLCCP